MGEGASAMTGWWALAAGSAALSGRAAFADQRRSRRRDLDRVGWAPWTGLKIIAIASAVVAAALALQA